MVSQRPAVFHHAGAERLKSIVYQSGYKYQLHGKYSIEVDHEEAVDSLFISLKNGKLTIRKGYAWDGPSGVSIDTANFMRGSLVHDAFYQLIREGHLPNTARLYADELLRKICREDGMWRIRAWYVFKAVRWFARSASLPSNRRPVKEAP